MTPSSPRPGPDTEPPARRVPPIAILVAVSALGPLALQIVMPSMPGLTAAFGTDYATVQLTLSVYMGGLAVSHLIYGPLSDRYGRRPLLLAGLGLFMVGTLVCLLAPTITVLILGRLVQAVGACAGLVLARAIVRDMYDRERSASLIGYITMAFVVAPMLAPAIGGYLDEVLGWRASFALVGVVGAAVLALSLGLLHETNHERQPMPGLAGMVESYRTLFAVPVFRGYAALTAFITAGFFGFLGGAPYVMVSIMDRPPSEYGLYFMVNASGYMLGNYLAGRLSERLGVDRMIGLGVAVSMLGAVKLLALALAGMVEPIALFAPMTVLAIGNGMALPNGMAGAVSVNPRLAGAASGVSGCLQMGVGALSGMVVGVLVPGAASQLPMAAVIFGMTVLAMLSYLLIRRAQRPAIAPAAAGPAAAGPAADSA